MGIDSLRAAILGLSLLGSTAAFAQVEVKPVQNKNLGLTLAVRVTEDIAPGDYERLLQGLKDNPGKFARKIALLDSIGGSLGEAIKMGRLLREAGFDTWVPRNSICQGTCVYLLAAGHARQVRGYVGLHRPYFPGGDSWLADGASRYSPAAYLREMDVPLSLLDDMGAIEPGRMRVLSTQDLARYRLD
ncbi:hypothetical protein [Pseudomonas citronellolis]|uniref:COG3904 family protein n=1 Tax=Pseudomonas citronellolis TaxID=53408 RepID=UPI0023E3A77C|nr:hypothetical protein [Pseudomonas citronellolis]MDF3933388.1 hypothetical protein [Pseudomonas citronellolis]